MPHGILSQAPDDKACQIDSYLHFSMEAAVVSAEKMEAAVVSAEKAAIPALEAVWLRPAWADRDCEKKESPSTVSDINVAAFGPTFILPLLVRVWPFSVVQYIIIRAMRGVY